MDVANLTVKEFQFKMEFDIGTKFAVQVFKVSDNFKLLKIQYIL
jgi:hypothetical protein